MHGLRVTPVLGVPDVAASAAWWRDTLGFHLDPEVGLFRPVAEDGAVYGILSLGDVQVHLQIRRRPVFAGERESEETDAYVVVDDVDATYDQHRAAGAAIHRPIEDSPYGMRDYVVGTPDGHRVAFGSPTS